MVSDIDLQDNKRKLPPFYPFFVLIRMKHAEIPEATYMLELPVFLGLAEKDPLAIPSLMKSTTEKFCKNVMVKAFSGSHWLLWDNKDEVNTELAAWLETLNAAA